MLIKDIKKELIKRGVIYNGSCYAVIRGNKKINFFVSNHVNMKKFIMMYECYGTICFIANLYKIDVWYGANSWPYLLKSFEKLGDIQEIVDAILFYCQRW